MIRQHPLAATGIAALLGFVSGPPLLRGLGRLATSKPVRSLFARRRPRALPDLLTRTLRIGRVLRR